VSAESGSGADRPRRVVAVPVVNVLVVVDVAPPRPLVSSRTCCTPRCRVGGSSPASTCYPNGQSTTEALPEQLFPAFIAHQPDPPSGGDWEPLSRSNTPHEVRGALAPRWSRAVSSLCRVVWVVLSVPRWSQPVLRMHRSLLATRPAVGSGWGALTEYKRKTRAFLRWCFSQTSLLAICIEFHCPA
jgi:hypothetical protein